MLACIAPEEAGDGDTKARWDMQGHYRLTADDTIKVTLNIGGVERRATTSGEDQIVDLGMHKGQPLVLNLSEYCGREEVVCPSEALWREMAVHQKDVSKGYDAHVVNFIDLATPPEGQKAPVLGGFVNHKDRDRFILGIDGDNAKNGDCGALAISLAAGRFERAGERMETYTAYVDEKGKVCDPSEEPGEDATTCTPTERERLVIPPNGEVIGIQQGKIGMGWLGLCAFGPIVAGATLTIETGFTAKRFADLDPPEFDQVDNPEVPDENVFEDNDMGSDMDSDAGADMDSDEGPDMDEADMGSDDD
jgi:hypothetical protein